MLMRQADRQPASPLFTAATVLLFVLLIPTWDPRPPTGGLDPSWTQVISWAYLSGKHFGHDVVYTFGPLGFLITKLYAPSTFPLVLGFTLMFGGTLGVATAAVLSRRPGPERILLLGAVIWGLLVESQTVFFLAGLLLLVLGTDEEPRSHLVLGLLLSALMALTGLAKHTVLVLGLAAVVCTDGYGLLSMRRWPVCSSVFAVTGLAGWMASGQPLAGLPEYFRTGIEVVRGYDAAVQLSTSSALPMIYLAAVAAMLIPIAVRAWKGMDRQVGVLLLYCAFELFVAFKHGFVRANGHKTIAFGGSVLILSVMLAAAAHSLSIRTARTLLAAPVVLALVWATNPYGRVHTSLSEKARGLATVLTGQAAATYHAQFEYSRDSLRRELPLPGISGTVDVYGWQQAAAFAHDLDYRPRPVFQGYLAHTQPLIDLNLSYLRSDEAARTLLFDVGSIDDRYPSLDDGALWPEIISRYRQVDTTEDFLVLRRRERPLAVSITALEQTRAAFGADIPIGSDSPVVWADIDFTETTVGKVISAAFRPPIIRIRVQLVTGEEKEYRLVPAMAGAGFLLSPLIETREQFSALLNGDLGALQSQRVRKVTILSTAALRRAYQQPIPVALFALRIGSP
jgi:hypothetical protein